jgi:hypothetical protein
MPLVGFRAAYFYGGACDREGTHGVDRGSSSLQREASAATGYSRSVTSDPVYVSYAADVQSSTAGGMVHGPGDALL